MAWAEVVSPDSRTLYVANYSEKTVSVIDTATNAVTSTIFVRDWAQDLAIVLDNYGAAGDSAITPDGKYLYVTYSGGVVLMFDTSTNQVVGPPITVGQDPRSVVIAPDGRRAYVLTGSLLGSDSVVVIDISP